MSILAQDQREIKSVENHAGCLLCRVGTNDITKIEVYDEHGQMAMIPWLAIYQNDKIIARMDAANKTIIYKH
jgi:hypothetical protein